MSYVNNMSYELCKSYEYFYESLEIVWIYFKYNIFCYQVFSKRFHERMRMENPSYKIAWNHSKITWIVLNITFSIFKIFQKLFVNIYRWKSFQKFLWIYKDGKPKL